MIEEGGRRRREKGGEDGRVGGEVGEGLLESEGRYCKGERW
jgi:hypothetical protein